MATTFDPAHLVGATLSNGNLSLTTTASTGAGGQSISTTSHTSGKYHIEFTMTTGGSGLDKNIAFGFVSASYVLSTGGIGGNTTGFGVWSGLRVNSLTYFNSVTTNLPSNCGWTTGDTVAVEVDLGAKLLWFKNATAGTSWNGNASANPATGIGGIDISGITGSPYFFNINTFVLNSVMTVNFGASAFALTPSSSFQTWDGTSAQVTQAALEQWMNANAQAQATQLAVEMWGLTGTVGTRAVVTQVGLEEWAKIVATQRARARAMILV